MPQGSQNQEDEWFMDYDFDEMNSIENRERNVDALGMGDLVLAGLRNMSPSRTSPKKVILNLGDENEFDAEALQDFWIRRNEYGRKRPMSKVENSRCQNGRCC